jgi:hypothetical protein
VTGPDAVGWHSTPTWHVCEAPKEPSQVSIDLMNGADAEMLKMVIVTFLESLLAETVCCGLMLPIATLPKLKLLGLIFRCAFPLAESPANASAGESRLIAKRRAKTENA